MHNLIEIETWKFIMLFVFAVAGGVNILLDIFGIK